MNGDGFYGGKAGTYEIDETYLETEVFASNGINGDYNWNTGGSGKAGASVYGGHGWGSGKQNGRHRVLSRRHKRNFNPYTGGIMSV